jgi:hypothetical protein
LHILLVRRHHETSQIKRGDFLAGCQLVGMRQASKMERFSLLASETGADIIYPVRDMPSFFARITTADKTSHSLEPGTVRGFTALRPSSPDSSM